MVAVTSDHSQTSPKLQLKGGSVQPLGSALLHLELARSLFASAKLNYATYIVKGSAEHEITKLKIFKAPMLHVGTTLCLDL